MLPITTGSISSPMGLGSDSLPVKVNLEGIDTYLADSMQFFLEFAERIYDTGAYYIAPSFRGEKADKRHLCQFYHSEVEIKGTIDDVMLIAEQYIFHIINYVVSKGLLDYIRLAAGTTEHIEEILKYTHSEFPIVTVEEAYILLGENEKYYSNIDGYKVINSLGEKKLMQEYKGFVWLKDFEHMTVPFYQAFGDGNKARCADLLFGMGETVGAGERHLSSVDVEKALHMHGVDQQEYEWYLQLKDYVSMQTSGFGMGIERFLAWIFQHDDIRDFQILPRFNGEKIYF